MYQSDKSLVLLLLVNVLQPIPATRLKSEFDQILRRQLGKTSEQEPHFEALIKRLENATLIIKKGQEYSVTLAGLQKIGALGLERLRDKGRLFFLKRLM